MVIVKSEVGMKTVMTKKWSHSEACVMGVYADIAYFLSKRLGNAYKDMGALTSSLRSRPITVIWVDCAKNREIKMCDVVVIGGCSPCDDKRVNLCDIVAIMMLYVLTVLVILR